jgi:hypothetical protein
MSATPIAPASRYFAVGVTKIYFCPAIANLNAPTRPELDAGKDLSGEVADVDGWQVASNLIDTPDLLRTFTGQISGRTTSDASSITFYASEDTDDVRTLLPRDTEGFIVWLDGGDVATQKMDIYPVKVSAAPKLRTLGDEASRIQVMFAISREPAEDVAIPA